jgi:hypothetical protein
MTDKKKENNKSVGVENFPNVKNYLDLYEALSKKAETETQPKFDPQKHKDTIRGYIAMTFTISFFALVVIILIGLPIYNILVKDCPQKILDLKDTLVIISSVVGGPFGFVIGYYFKGSEGK